MDLYRTLKVLLEAYLKTPSISIIRIHYLIKSKFIAFMYSSSTRDTVQRIIESRSFPNQELCFFLTVIFPFLSTLLIKQ